MSLAGVARQELLKQRGDLSPFLIHLTRSGDLKLDKEIHSLQRDKVIQIGARTSLESIIKAKRIEAKSAFGYFNYKVPFQRNNGTLLNSKSMIRRDWLRSVCFTETPVDHVYLQMQPIQGRQLHFEPYGLAFFEVPVRIANGNPVFYLQTTNRSIKDGLDLLAESPLAVNMKAMLPLIEGFGIPWFQRMYGPSEIDFRWEREWRIAGDFSFNLSDIAFGFCRQADIPYFETLVNHAFPFVEPTRDMNTAKQRLRTSASLGNLK